MARWRQFLPRIAQAHVGAVGEPDSPLVLFTAAWLALLGERAATIRYDARLAQAAQQQADWLASRSGEQLLQSMHVGRNGSYSNQRVMEAGYRLPGNFKTHANNVESCARDRRDPSTVIASLAAHEGHHEHLMGLGGFSAHTVYGMGHCGDDWVVVICPPE